MAPLFRGFRSAASRTPLALTVLFHVPSEEGADVVERLDLFGAACRGHAPMISSSPNSGSSPWKLDSRSGLSAGQDSRWTPTALKLSLASFLPPRRAAIRGKNSYVNHT